MMQLKNVNLKTTLINDKILYNKKYTYQTDNTLFSRNSNFSKNNNKILMTKYDGTAQSGLSYFSIINSSDGSTKNNFISSQAIKIFSNISAADNSGFYLAGNNTQDGGNFINCLISKIDNNGNELWKYSYSAGSSNSFLNTMDLDSSGNIIAAGTATGITDTANTYPFFIKFNTSGVTQLAKIVENPTIGHKVFGITVDKSNDYVYFITRGTNEVLFGCLDNNFNVMWLKKLSYTGTVTFRAASTVGTNDSKINLAINGSSLYVTFSTNDTALVGGAPSKPVIIEFNKLNGNINKAQYINSSHISANIKFENGLMKLFGTVLISSDNFPFVSTVNNWSATPTYNGYYYNTVTLFSSQPSFTTGINNGYVYGYVNFPFVIKANHVNYDYLATTPISNSFTNLSVTLTNESSTRSTVTSSYNTPIAPTYTWTPTNITIS
jgi:hypothetical protein